MRNLTLSHLLVAVLLAGIPTQQRDGPDQPTLDPKFAETLLIHKEEPPCQKEAVGTRVRATAVIAITIDRNGRVIHAQWLSGPKILRPLVLATVRKYRYKPYLLHGTPIEVGTIVSVKIDCIFQTGQA